LARSKKQEARSKDNRMTMIYYSKVAPEVMRSCAVDLDTIIKRRKERKILENLYR
jgi:hypothetical protein